MNTLPHQFPSYTKAERRIDAAIHLIGIAAAPLASLWLLAQVSGFVLTASLSVYCIGLVAMLSVSGLYNMLPNIPVRELARRADHATIFVMIAGTYTPLVANRLEGGVGLYLGIFVWLTALAGVWLVLVRPHRYPRAKLAFYLLLGWIGVVAIVPLAAALRETTLSLLLAGGLAYSLGAGFHAIGRLRFHNAIWHGLVLLAAALHFLAMVYEFA